MTIPVHVETCPGCGAGIAHGARACDGCGRPAEAAQRRVVTLLFADLAGYTTLCETRDPEQVHLLVRPLMTSLRAICEERGAVVPGIQGDGFMAVFGGRTTLEDDPTRALDAAVRLQRAVQDRRAVLPDIPELRVGLHVGEVLAAGDPSGLAVSGDPVNVASRVCGAAAPGEVLVTTDALGLIRVDGGWSSERELRLRGREGSVRAAAFAWAEVPELVRGQRWSTTSPYVSRADLEHELATSLAAGNVLVVGSAGMGKTRLVRRVLEGRRVLEAAASATLRPSATGVCADLLERLPDPPVDLVGLLRGGASDGLSDIGMQLRAAGARIGRHTDAVFVDDVELLADDDVSRLQEAVAASGVPWVLASREPRTASSLTEVHVPPWRPDEAQELLDAMLPRASAELRRTVLERAGDCPLYVEQCVQLLLENGAVAVDPQGARVLDPDRLGEIPSSMRLFVSSRLDLLPHDQRDVLGMAAVLGPEPDLALLSHLAGSAAHLVEPLVDAGFLRWAPGPVGQPGLSFSHALVRDVAYESLLRSRRVQIHRAAAEWYAVLPVSQVLESQAYHLERAVMLERPDCELLRRTVEAMVLFARSIEAERTSVAREVLRRARSLAEGRHECGVDRLALELATASVEHLSGEMVRSREAAELALQLAEESGSRSSVAEAHLHLARTFRFADNARADEELSRAQEVYELVGDRGGTARVLVERAVMAEHQEGLAPYLGHLERAYHEAMRSADVRLQATCAQHLALHKAISVGRGAFEEWAGNARDVSRRDDVGLEPRLDLAAAVLADLELNPGLGLEEARRALAGGRDLGLAHVYHNALTAVLSLLVAAGELAEASALLPEARQYAGKYTTAWLSLQFDLLEARLLQRSGDVAGAVTLLDAVAAHDLSEQKVLRRDLAEARSWVALERGRFGEARALAVEAVAVDQELDERCSPLRPRLVELVATVAAGDAPSLGTIAALRAEARETGLTTIAQLANRWLYVDELTRGWSVDLHGLEELDVIECRALDLEIGALSSRLWDMLLDAAAIWGELGTTVWQARALLWHSELTGTPSPEADEVLRVLGAPEDLAETLRRQVRGLR
jgi:class 3 adenylate cyclase